MEFISLPFRLEFREFCVGLVLRQIDDIFQMAEIKSGTIPSDRNISGERRRRVEEYYASIDWTNQKDAEKFLTAIGLVLSQSYISQESKDFLYSGPCTDAARDISDNHRSIEFKGNGRGNSRCDRKILFS